VQDSSEEFDRGSALVVYQVTYLAASRLWLAKMLDPQLWAPAQALGPKTWVCGREGAAGELTSLVGVEDIGPAKTGDCLFECGDTEVGVQGVR
jgi:hypothetical protein